MYYRDFVKQFQEKAGVRSFFKARKLVESIFELITEVLIKGESLHFKKFGKITVVKRKERKGVHPATKSNIVIPEGRRVKFVPSQKLKNALNNK